MGIFDTVLRVAKRDPEGVRGPDRIGLFRPSFQQRHDVYGTAIVHPHVHAVLCPEFFEKRLQCLVLRARNDTEFRSCRSC